MTIMYNTKTTMQTEYGYFGKKPDGSWRQLGPFKTLITLAQKAMDEYRENVARMPKLYTAYEDYKVMSRTVITIIGEWEDVQE